MAKPTTIYQIFLSGPSDVSSDLELVKSVIQDVNLLLHYSGVKFETYHWIDDVTPGAGGEPQDRIHNQSDGYDIILSIFGMKIGSPTKEYASGTIEEIERALKKRPDLTFQNDSIMVFFKHFVIDGTHGDLESALAIQKFRFDLGSRQVTYKEFKNDDDLRSYTLKALSLVVAKHISLKAGSTSESGVTAYKQASHNPLEKSNSLPAIFQDDQDDEPGLLDLESIVGSKLVEATASVERVGGVLVRLGRTLDTAAAGINEATARGERAVVFQIIADTSKKMEMAAQQLYHESEMIPVAFGLAMDAVDQTLDLAPEAAQEPEARAQIAEFAGILENMIAQAAESIPPTKGLQVAISSSPRLSKSYTKSSRHLYKAMEEHVKNIELVIARGRELVVRLLAI